MAENPWVQRLHQQVHQAADQEWMDACAEVRNWRDTAYGLLAEVRRNLPAIVGRSGYSLKPLNLYSPRKEGKGRKQRTVREYEQTAGWPLRHWKRWDSTGEREASTDGADYLLYDGRLARGGYSDLAGVDIVDDKALMEMIRPGWGDRNNGRRVLERLATLLWDDPGLTRSQVPPAPTLPSWCEGVWEKMGGL